MKMMRNRETFMRKSRPIDCKLGKWYKAAVKIHAMYLIVK